MSKKYITNIFLMIILILIAFFTGFFYAGRELSITSKDNEINITNQYGYVDNVFSNIKQKAIYGLIDGSKQVYGDFFYIVNNQKTQLYFTLDNIPLTTNFQGLDEETPTQYSIYYAVNCCSGLDYEYTRYDQEINLIQDNETGKVNFTTNLDFDIENNGIQRIVLDSTDDPNNYKIIKDDQKDWPKNTLEKPAPYFWINF